MEIKKTFSIALGILVLAVPCLRAQSLTWYDGQAQPTNYGWGPGTLVEAAYADRTGSGGNGIDLTMNWTGWYDEWVDTPTNWGAPMDITPYTHLECWVKGIDLSNGCPLGFQFFDISNNPSSIISVQPNFITPATVTQPVGVIDNTWRKVSIPIAAFDYINPTPVGGPTTLFDPTQLELIGFECVPASASGNMELYMDDGQFVAGAATTVTSNQCVSFDDGESPPSTMTSSAAAGATVSLWADNTAGPYNGSYSFEMDFDTGLTATYAGMVCQARMNSAYDGGAGYIDATGATEIQFYANVPVGVPFRIGFEEASANGGDGDVWDGPMMTGMGAGYILYDAPIQAFTRNATDSTGANNTKDLQAVAFVRFEIIATGKELVTGSGYTQYSGSAWFDDICFMRPPPPPTSTPSATPTVTLTSSLTLTPSETRTPSLTLTESPTPSLSATVTLTPSQTFTPVPACNMYITTFAGNGTAGYSGDGGQATAGMLNSPLGVAVDSTGNIYIADWLNNCIRKITTSGVISTIAGNGIGGYTGDGGQATAAEINQPYGVAVDSIGNVYISDTSNHRIRRVDSSGMITTIAGNGIFGFIGDGGQATAAELHNPEGVAVDGTGNVYISDSLNDRVRRIDISGMITTFAGNGTWGFTGDGGQATAAELFGISGVAVDTLGNVYIADQGNNRIREVSLAGVIYTLAGNGIAGFSGDGGQATAAELNSCPGVATDSVGNVYIADKNNQCIRKVDTSGVITTLAGNGIAGYSGDGGQATAAQLFNPYGVGSDNVSNVYIADYLNNRIRKVYCPSATTPTQTVTPSLTLTSSSTLTPSETLTESQTLTPSATATVSLTSSETLTPSQTITVTQTVTPTASYTAAPSATQSSTLTPTVTLTPSITNTFTPSATPTPSGSLHVVDHFPYPNPVTSQTLNYIYLVLTDIPDVLDVRFYTTAGRFIRDINYNPQYSSIQGIVYEGPVARYAYSLPFDVKDGSDNNLANGLYYYVVEVKKKGIDIKVYGKMAVLR